jgi:hypothetical protein
MNGYITHHSDPALSLPRDLYVLLAIYHIPIRMRNSNLKDEKENRRFDLLSLYKYYNTPFDAHAIDAIPLNASLRHSERIEEKTPGKQTNWYLILSHRVVACLISHPIPSFCIIPHSRIFLFLPFPSSAPRKKPWRRIKEKNGEK